MLSLFRKREANPAAALYASVVEAARQPGWYRDAGVPDTLDGRYCVLATLLAITDLRLGEGGEVTAELSARLTETLVEDLDVQLRESGLGDPTLGKTVRGLVNGLSGRIARWRAVLNEGGDWRPAIEASLYRDGAPGDAELEAAKTLIAAWRDRLARTGQEKFREGISA